MDSLVCFVSLPHDQTLSKLDGFSQALSHSGVFFFLLLENWTSNECFFWDTAFILEFKKHDDDSSSTYSTEQVLNTKH